MGQLRWAPVFVGGARALGVRGWVRRGPLWGCLIVVPVLQAVSTGTLLSFPRILLSAFPVAVEVADLPYGRVLRWGVVLLGPPAQLWLLHRYMLNGGIG